MSNSFVFTLSIVLATPQMCIVVYGFHLIRPFQIDSLFIGLNRPNILHLQIGIKKNKTNIRFEAHDWCSIDMASTS